ncbi:Spc98 family-domain-containing protein [Amylocystis lapponica]|nr:Spc98 family-domain-containing protein [Amylocystis lapponica]
MDPYTPRPRTATRKKNLTLSAKEYTQVTGTIASVRRTHRYFDDGLDEDAGAHAPSSRGRDSLGRARDEPSFIAETSFVRAPLNSRVPSGAVPRDKDWSKGKGKAREGSLAGVPIDIQEALILEDLLFVLMGIEGTYITYHPDYSPDDDDPLQGVRFVVSSSLDPSLRDLVERVLPLATYYTAITSFIELRSHLDFGLVNHALCAAMRDMLKDYQTLLSQLEHAFSSSPHFTLQKLWFYVHPTLHTLSLLYLLTTELATADDPSSVSSASSSSSDEDEARNEALGLGGAKLKAVLSEINKGALDGGASGIAVKGGEVLAVLYERMEHMAGDPAANALYGALLRAAGTPYVAMVQAWIRTGRLDDPYEELCVKESKFIDRGTLEMDYTDEYWERRYTLRDGSTMGGSSKRHQAGVPPPRTPGGRLPGGACVPPPLERWKHKMLLAGKYLNVIRECGIEIRRDPSHAEDEDEELSMDDEKFYRSIENAYAHANRTLLQLLLSDQQLMPRLRSLKRYFFLAQSSFLTHLLDLAHTELRKSARAVSLSKLQSLLDLALGSDAQGEDALFREDVRVAIAGNGLYEWLLKVVSVSGVIGSEEEGADGHAQEEPKKEKDKDDKKQMLAIDALSLDYTVKFPLSLVISRKTILRYQLIFRFLLHLKHVEQSLSAMWIEHKTPPWRRPTRPAGSVSEPGDWHTDFQNWRKRVFLLRARMLAFVQQILAFATFEVLEPNWRKLEDKLAGGKVETVDQLLRDHVDFLDTCLKECMLTSSKLLKAYSRLIVTCSTFALYTASFTKSANQALAAADTPDCDTAMAKRWDFLGKFETNFNHWFKVHLDCVQFYASSENVSLLPLVVRLNSIKTMS